METQPKSLIEDVTAFHEKFKLEPLAKPGFLPPSLMEFRLKFLKEELDEIVEGTISQDLPEVLDGLVDIVYVAIGTAYLMGLPFQAAWDEVQRANMSKVRAKRPEESKRGSSYDVVKPKDWVSPDIGSIIEQYELDLGGL
jgi:predicted HAD superfamily Cof-like phosphohydrolase